MVSESSSAPSRSIFLAMGDDRPLFDARPFFRGPFSSVLDLLLMSVRISHFQLRFVTAILTE